MKVSFLSDWPVTCFQLYDIVGCLIIIYVTRLTDGLTGGFMNFLKFMGYSLRLLVPPVNFLIFIETLIPSPRGYFKFCQDWFHRKGLRFHDPGHRRVVAGPPGDLHNRAAFPIPYLLLHQRSWSTARGRFQHWQ